MSDLLTLSGEPGWTYTPGMPCSSGSDRQQLTRDMVVFDYAGLVQPGGDSPDSVLPQINDTGSTWRNYRRSGHPGARRLGAADDDFLATETVDAGVCGLAEAVAPKIFAEITRR